MNAVSKGSKIADDTAIALDRVVNSESKVAAMVEKIAVSSIEQSDSIKQITVGVEQISSVVQINAATAEESAATAEELSGQSSLLKELVQQFNL